MLKSGQLNSPYKILVCSVILVTIALSIWQARYTVSPLEFGLMLSNAKDLANGLKPYESIFIQYGFLTTLIHTLAYKLMGENILAIMGITAVAYGVGLYIVYKISISVGFEQKTSLLLILIYILFHPIVIYPWANYIAFPMIMLGLKFSLETTESNTKHLVTGICFGMAILAREGLAPAMVVYLALSNLLTITTLNRKCIFKHLKYLVSSLCGLGIIILPFIGYLEYIDAIKYWKQSAFDVPRIYAEVMFPHMRGFNIWRIWTIFPMFEALSKQIALGLIELEFRWMIFIIIVLINIFISLKAVFNSNFRHEQTKSIKIAMLTLLLLTTTLHLSELFRIATGSLIGILNVFIFIKRSRYLSAAAIVLAIGLLPTVFPDNAGKNFSTTNYFFPTSEKRVNSEKFEGIVYFSGQLWSRALIDYYKNIEHDLNVIQKACPSVKYHHNNTHDTFLHILSPFTKYQMTPFWFFPKMNELRLDLNLSQQIESQSVLLFRTKIVPNGSMESNPPNGYKKFNVYIDPLTREPMYIMIPIRCLATTSSNMR